MFLTKTMPKHEPFTLHTCSHQAKIQSSPTIYNLQPNLQSSTGLGRNTADNLWHKILIRKLHLKPPHPRCNQTFELSMRETLPNTTTWTMQERQKAIIR